MADYQPILPDDQLGPFNTGIRDDIVSEAEQQQLRVLIGTTREARAS